MVVFPGPEDSPEMVKLMEAIDRQWKRTVRLRKAMLASDKREGLLRAQLRLMQDGVVEGETLTLLPQGAVGILEVSEDSPHLWLRLTDKAGRPSKRRLKIEMNAVVRRPDGSFPVPAPGHGEERQRTIERHFLNK